ncbi:hypothetical protein AB0R12_37575 [Streptomyces niveus]|uniref:hypothetical protein n=1 Tax=Streptomyces niveus TaxID=193462 RepID=UPI00341E8AE7
MVTPTTAASPRSKSRLRQVGRGSGPVGRSSDLAASWSCVTAGVFVTGPFSSATGGGRVGRGDHVGHPRTPVDYIAGMTPVAVVRARYGSYLRRPSCRGRGRS